MLAGCTFSPSLLLASRSFPCLYPTDQSDIDTHSHKDKWQQEWFSSKPSPTFRYVSPLFSYSNLQSVLCKMLMVDWLAWILKAVKQNTELSSWSISLCRHSCDAISYEGQWIPCVRQCWQCHQKDSSEASCSRPLRPHTVLHKITTQHPVDLPTFTFLLSQFWHIGSCISNFTP